MESFIVGTGIGCLIGVAAAYLVVSRSQDDEPPSWRELMSQQGAALKELESHRAKPRALTRLTNHTGTIEL